MKSTEKNKDFDAVKMMREIRDKVNADTHEMSFEQLKAYIKRQLSNHPAKLIGQK